MKKKIDFDLEFFCYSAGVCIYRNRDDIDTSSTLFAQSTIICKWVPRESSTMIACRLVWYNRTCNYRVNLCRSWNAQYDYIPYRYHNQWYRYTVMISIHIILRHTHTKSISIWHLSYRYHGRVRGTHTHGFGCTAEQYHIDIDTTHYVSIPSNQSTPCQTWLWCQWRNVKYNVMTYRYEHTPIDTETIFRRHCQYVRIVENSVSIRAHNVSVLTIYRSIVSISTYLYRYNDSGGENCIDTTCFVTIQCNQSSPSETWPDAHEETSSTNHVCIDTYTSVSIQTWFFTTNCSYELIWTDL